MILKHVGRVAFGVAVLGSILGGCDKVKSVMPGAKPAGKVVELDKGTEVSLVLLKPLESGVDAEGTDVAMLVSEDVKDTSGNIVVRKGAPAQGRVSWSRKEDMMGAITNRPARLNIELKATVGVDGTAINLAADKKDPKKAFELNRGNTGRGPSLRQIERLFEDEKDQAILKAMNDAMEGKSGSDLLESTESKTRLARIGRELKLPSLAALADKGEVGKVQPMINELRSGANLAQAAGSGGVTLGAILEIAQITKQVGSHLDAITRGRNIKAHVGTPITAYVADSVKVTVPAQ